MRILSPAKALTLSLILIFGISACAPAPVNLPSTAIPNPTATRFPTTVPTVTPTPLPEGYVRYISQSGDTLPAVAVHFGVETTQIIGAKNLPRTAILDPGSELLVPDTLEQTTQGEILLPDSAVVYSTYAIGFDIQEFADEQNGFLAAYTELMVRGTTLASEVISQLALEHSINPKILLALMEAEIGRAHV